MVKNLVILALLFSGCSVGPSYVPPDMDVPSEWHSVVSPVSSTPSDSFSWWESFNDPLLNYLIETAASQNLDLYIASSRILEARAERRAKTGDFYPHVDFSVDGGHAYYSKEALKSILGSNARDVKRHTNFFEVGFDAEWEMDLFGRAAHEIKALKAQEEAVEESFCAIWISLAAEIAKNTFELRGQQSRLKILERNLETLDHTAVLSQELVQRGVISEIEAHQIKSQLKTLAAEKPVLHLGIQRAIHRLSILLGYAPGELFEDLSQFYPLPKLPQEIPLGVPSELLRRRPDIRKAERELAAATEKIGSAVASLFPRLSLHGFVGDISTCAGSLFSPASATWLAGPQLLLPIFNSHLIMQDIEYNEILTQKAIYQYQKTVLEALEETENAIAAHHAELERNHHLKAATQASQRALELTQQLYELGIKDKREVLIATREFIAAESASWQSQVDLLLSYVALYKALGGCW